jgi:fructose-1-phosphate kinase PfkB-like protein
MKNSVTLDDAIDAASRLPKDQQQMLIEILRNRQIDARRQEIAEDARQTVALFRQGKLVPQSAKDVIAELHEELEQDQ